MKRFVYYTFLGALVIGSLCSCGQTSSEVSSSPTFQNPIIRSNLDEDPVELKAPFYVLNQNGEEVARFDNQFEAIRKAGKDSTKKVKLQVQDDNHVQIYNYTNLNEWYIFESLDYVGTVNKSIGKSYIDAHPYSYAVNGIASKYARLGHVFMTENTDADEAFMELEHGGNNFILSNNFVGTTDETFGYAYFSTTIRMSQTTIKRSLDGGVWNPYMFINVKNHLDSCIDLGVIGIYNEQKDCYEWKMCRNCLSQENHTSNDQFVVFDDKIVTSMDQYNSDTREYSGADDVLFEAICLENGFSCRMTNLTTNKVVEFEDIHENPNKKYGRTLTMFLLAESYPPVEGQIWNARSGAALRNVVYEEPYLTTYVDDNYESYHNDSLKKYSLYPGGEAFDYGFSQAHDCSSFEFTEHKQDGTYPSGATYKKGEMYFSLSSFYDGEGYKPLNL